MPPRISVIIPTYNGGQLLERCLHALEPERHHLHEVIVVDDASTDGSAALARDLGATVHVMEENAGPSAARNAGAKLATGDLLWFMDSDTEARPDAVARVLAHFAAHPEEVAAIGSYDDTPSRRSACSQFKNLFHHFVHQNAPAFVSSFWSGCGVIQRDVFLDMGGFDAEYWREPMIEDIHLGYELGKRGHRIAMLRDVQVTHHKIWTLYSMVKTDVFHRAVPWTVLLLRHRPGGNKELNLGGNYRLSVVLVYLALLGIPAGFVYTEALLAAGICLLLVIPLNMGLLSFFMRKRGIFFFLQSVALLWLYFFYCGVGLGLGILKYLREEATGKKPSGSPRP